MLLAIQLGIAGHPHKTPVRAKSYRKVCLEEGDTEYDNANNRTEVHYRCGVRNEKLDPLRDAGPWHCLPETTWQHASTTMVHERPSAAADREG
ncbi:hypothetical protein NDU88_011322 [Pleurodeles waltl]|uniref:Uncharacterized protein n=1 Tax=Pleurodeles waltl TaxID=8319 RepID=A0AAV7R0M7_PLEWA|nr:hypothetical protein NDU88_011322 [Pleurodeles waltl]